MTARITGLAALLFAMLTWGTFDHPMMIAATWLGFLSGAYLITQATMALSLTLALLCGAHLANCTSPAECWTYGIGAALGGGVTLFILARRFRQRIVETRAARWENRNS